MPDWVLQDAYSHEVNDAGFWTGSAGLPEAAFYCYLYPEPDGYQTAQIEPGDAYYHKEMGEFILTYADVQRSEDPAQKLLAFLTSTYLVGAALAKWGEEFVEAIPKGRK